MLEQAWEVTSFIFQICLTPGEEIITVESSCLENANIALQV